MSYITGSARDQQVLFPEVLDDYVGADNPVRVLDAFVSTLDLAALGFLRATANDTGRPPYDPADVLRLYLYGYLYRVRSRRKLEQETHRNIEVLWLLRKWRPDVKTIADFRRDNPAALKGVCRSFTLLCKKLELLGGEAVLDDMEQRHAQHPERSALRKTIVDHPFGTMKRSMDHGYFLCRGLAKVRAEFSLTVFAYNLKRTITIVGVPRLIAALA